MEPTKLRQKLVVVLPPDLQIKIWQTYYSNYVMNEIVHVTKDSNIEYEELYDECCETMREMVEVTTELSMTDAFVWNITLTNVECNILVDDVLCSYDEDLYKVFQCVKTFALFPSILKIELSKLYYRTCDDLRLMKDMCETLHRMFVSNM